MALLQELLMLLTMELSQLRSRSTVVVMIAHRACHSNIVWVGCLGDCSSNSNGSLCVLQLLKLLDLLAVLLQLLEFIGIQAGVGVAKWPLKPIDSHWMTRSSLHLSDHLRNSRGTSSPGGKTRVMVLDSGTVHGDMTMRNRPLVILDAFRLTHQQLVLLLRHDREC